MKISLVTLGDPAKPTGGYLYHQRMADAAGEQGAELRFESLPERPFPLSAVDARGLVARLARCDAVVVDSIAAAFLAPWLRRARLGAPLIGSLHQPPGGIDHGRLRTSLQAALDRATYRRASKLLVASDSLAHELAGQGIAADKIVVVAPGRDVARSREPVGDLRNGRKAALLCVGNWIPRKGITSLLDAFARLPEPSATLHLVGDDRADPAYARKVRARLARRDVGGRVVVHGVVPKERVAAMYDAADVFVLPSVKEPYGTVYGEAMAAGLPVVGWDAGNLPHLATDQREGRILSVGDVDRLAAALEELCDDAGLREHLGAAAKARARSFPTWEETAATFFGSIREAVERAARAAAS